MAKSIWTICLCGSILNKVVNIGFKKDFVIKSCIFVPANCHIIINFFVMNTGTVKFFNEAKGFGFIVDSTSKEEIFVHATGLIDHIREGDVVNFNTERGNKGMNAIDVKIA